MVARSANGAKPNASGKCGFGRRALERTTGSHRTLRHRAYPVRLNLQPVRGEAKPYQIQQFLRLVERHGLEWEKSED